VKDSCHIEGAPTMPFSVHTLDRSALQASTFTFPSDRAIQSRQRLRISSSEDLRPTGKVAVPLPRDRPILV